jgi:ubiquinone/menaquinone biosynthesis C-methylase UbiE
MQNSEKHVMRGVELQREYYASTANDYDQMRVGSNEQAMALAEAFLKSAIAYLNAQSLLDIGAGTGRTLSEIKSAYPRLRCVGVEPVAELRQVGLRAGLTADELLDGDANHLQFADNEFDVVCEFGILHHVPDPARVVGEMLRVARNAIFVCDSNNFGQGSPVARALKQALNAVGIWPIADFIKTRGKGYTISEGDGVAYSYSVFNNLAQIRRSCAAVHYMNTVDAGSNLYRDAPGLALLGIKKID